MTKAPNEVGGWQLCLPQEARGFIVKILPS